MTGYPNPSTPLTLNVLDGRRRNGLPGGAVVTCAPRGAPSDPPPAASAREAPERRLRVVIDAPAGTAHQGDRVGDSRYSTDTLPCTATLSRFPDRARQQRWRRRANVTSVGEQPGSVIRAPSLLPWLKAEVLPGGRERACAPPQPGAQARRARRRAPSRRRSRPGSNRRRAPRQGSSPRRRRP